MKRVLIISYYWPPSGGAGVQRWLKFAKYLRGFGWEPVIYCPENPEYPETDPSLEKDIPAGLEVLKHPIWEPYDAYKTFLGQKKEVRINTGFLSETKKNKILEQISVWIRGNLFIPDARRFWIRPSVRYLKGYLADHPVMAVVSTGPPHTTHLIAMKIARQFHLPWLADFRDPWTNIDFYTDLKLTAWADRKHRRLERQVLRTASAVTVISPLMAEDFNGIIARNYDVVTNGYDPDDIPDAPIALDSKFSVAHIGTLVATRNPVTLWEALRSLLESEPGLPEDLEIKLVGKVDHTVMESLRAHGLEDHLRKIEYMPHDAVTQCQRQSQVLLLIINDTPNARMILTGKFFEYLAVGRPILCLGPVDGDAARVLTETRSGLVAGFGDVAAMTAHIRDLYRAYKAGTLGVKGENIGGYSRKELTKKIAAVLDRISP